MILKKTNLSWLLGLPVYILINSLRHEISNAFMVWLTNGKLLHFSFLPGFSTSGWLEYGSIRWVGGVEWLILAAPYIGDLLFFSLIAYFCHEKQFKNQWLLTNLIIIGLLSPIFNTGYEYFSSIFKQTDVTHLIELMPLDELVHIAFVMVLGFYVLVFNAVLHSSATVKYLQDQAITEKRRIREIKRSVKQERKELSANTKNSRVEVQDHSIDE